MRVILHPGANTEVEVDLAHYLCRMARNSHEDMLGNLIALLAEKGVLALEDLRQFGVPHMEKAE